MPQSIPEGLTRDCVIRALADLDASVEHPFGPPTGYELVHEGRRYAPKAVVGLASRSLLGRVLRPDEFSGGEAPGQANYVLRALGFAVVPKGTPVPDVDEGASAREWTRREADSAVADYFAKLRGDLAGAVDTQLDRDRGPRAPIGDRPEPSMEARYRQISAALLGMGLPYLAGHSPVWVSGDTLLPHAISDYIAGHPADLDALAEAPVVDPLVIPDVADRPFESLFDAPPDRIVIPGGHEKPWLSRRGRRVDFARRDAENRRLGRLGEEFAVDVERRRLLASGRDDLAARVEWVAKACGDGLGFDVLSFDEADDAERFVEVKTTGLGKHFPFYVTATEVRCSEDCPDRFHLYRVFDSPRVPRLYALSGPLTRACLLEPVVYRVSICPAQGDH